MEITANILSAKSQVANVNVVNVIWIHHITPISHHVLNVSHVMDVNLYPPKKRNKTIIIYVVYGVME